MKNNEIWFKRKTYGWGWVPVKWQGWMVIFVYVFSITFIISITEKDILGNPDSGSNFLTHALPIIVFTIFLVYICYKKGEKPKWQWGKKKED